MMMMMTSMRRTNGTASSSVRCIFCFALAPVLKILTRFCVDTVSFYATRARLPPAARSQWWPATIEKYDDGLQQFKCHDGSRRTVYNLCYDEHKDGDDHFETETHKVCFINSDDLECVDVFDLHAGTGASSAADGGDEGAEATVLKWQFEAAHTSQEILEYLDEQEREADAMGMPSAEEQLRFVLVSRRHCPRAIVV